MAWLQAVRTAVLQSNYWTLVYCSIIRVCSENTLSTSLLHLAFLALEKKTVRLKQMQIKWDGTITHPAGMVAMAAALMNCAFWEAILCHWAVVSHCSKDYSACIFSVKNPSSFCTAWPRGYRQYDLSKLQELLVQWQCVTSQKSLNLQQHLCENLKSCH